MTLDEAIKHCENVAAKCFVERSARNHSGKCGFEHLELAAWLRELKAYKEQGPCEDAREAIKTLKENLCSVCAYGAQNMESCDIRSCDNRDAIKALEQEPCEDAISREEMLKYQYYLHGKMPNEENHKLWQFIKSLPSVTPKQKTVEWIELKDQKPEEFENVLVKDIDGDVTCAYLCNDGHFLERFSGEIIDDVVEWREIP